MKRSASATWSGDLKQGKGTLSSDSGVLKDTPYGFASRFEAQPGTNPEELIAAAHAGCFTMALSATLGQAGFRPQSLATRAVVSFDQVDGAWTVTESRLELVARIPGISREKFSELAADAKMKCPISRLLNTRITLDAQLEAAETSQAM